MRQFLFCLLAVASGAAAQEMAFQVQLRTPLSTEKNHKGDAVMAIVVSPDAFKNDLMEGKVTEVKSGNKLRGQSVLNFTFETIQHAGQTVPVSSSVTSMMNSKGQENVDEEGRVIRKSSNLGKAAAGTGAGALIGGLAGGLKGAAIGAGVGAAASIVLIEVAAEGPKVEFAPGSMFGLSVKSRGGPNLSTLAPSGGGAPAAATASAVPPSATPAPAAAAPAASGADAGQPQFTTAKIDFVPGEKTVFFEDFSDMAPDEPPPHWKLRGHPVELHIGPGLRELYAAEDVELTSGSIAVPKNFTFELEFTGTGETRWRFRDKDDNDTLDLMVRGEPDEHEANCNVEWSGHSTLGAGHVQTSASTNTTSIQFAVWVQDGRVRAYLNGQRVVDVNQVSVAAIDHLFVSLAGYRPTGIRKVRIAESAPDPGAMLSSTGKYVTHGIYFDTNSDRLKLESAPVIKQIASALIKNPNLKLEIDGYTDSTGDAAKNLDLSQRRAEAVRQVLTSQFGVDAARLTSKGFGPDKPLGSNDTPEGRAENRRVEFVKQ
jgi:outer membrane protein OmpA-like peptidoglycan-associated protein